MKKIIGLMAAGVLCAGVLAGCSSESGAGSTTAAQNSGVTEAVTSEEAADDAAKASEDGEGTGNVTLPEIVRVGSLKGPTSMGLANMEYEDYMGEYAGLMDYYMAVQADEIVTMLVKEELDIALIPANLASVLYNKTEGGVSVIDINTLGVLYVVECGDTVESISDLAGKTLYMTGKGTTPDYALQFLLGANGLSTEDLTIEYRSEATEVAAIL